MQHDRHVGSVEELNGIGSTLSTEPVGLDGDLNTEALKVDNSGESNGGGNEIRDVGEASAPESLAESAALVIPGEEEVEEGNEGTLEFWSTAGVDSGGREGLPDDGLASVG